MVRSNKPVPPYESRCPMETFALHLVASPLAETTGVWTSLQDLFLALGNLIVSLLQTVAPWTPLLAWIAFWLFAVNWVKLRSVMTAGGWIGVVLIGLVWVATWGTISPAEEHHLLGLTVSNYVGKTVFVTVLLCIMFLCGSLQLAGFLPACCSHDAESTDDAHAH